jgi:hypothetical protein
VRWGKIVLCAGNDIFLALFLDSQIHIPAHVEFERSKKVWEFLLSSQAASIAAASQSTLAMVLCVIAKAWRPGHLLVA